jgi:hypothetical protein
MKKIWDLIHNLHIFFPCLSLVKLRKFNFGRLSQLLFIVAIVLGSNPHYGDHFLGTIHLDQSLEQKLWKNSNLALLHVL